MVFTVSSIPFLPLSLWIGDEVATPPAISGIVLRFRNPRFQILDDS